MARTTVEKKEEVDYEIHIPNVGNKRFHINILKTWSDLEPVYEAFLGIEAYFHWDEEGRIWTEELRLQIEEGISLSVWQTQQIDQVLSDSPDVFADVPGTAWGGVPLNSRTTRGGSS